MRNKIRDDEIIRLEERSINAWPALKNIQYKGCILRLSDGYTKRSNSANPLYYKDTPGKLIEYVEDFYIRHDQDVIFKILSPSESSQNGYHHLDRALEDRYYKRLDPTTVKLKPLLDGKFTIHSEVLLEDDFSPQWIESYIESNHLDAKAQTVSSMLRFIAVDKIVARVVIDGSIIAFGYAALEDGYAGFFDIFVVQDHRGFGFGRKLMESLLAAARRKGAHYAYLQVMDDNHPANSLYDSLGFKPAYAYWYRKKAPLPIS